MVSSSSSTNKKERPTKTTKYTKQSKSRSLTTNSRSLTTCNICDGGYKELIPCNDCSEQFCINCWETNMDKNPSKPCLSVNCSFRVNQLFLKRNNFPQTFVHNWSEREKSRLLDVEQNLIYKMLNKNNNNNNKNIAVSSTSKYKTTVVLTLDCPVCPSKPKVDPEHCVFFTNNLETTVCNKTICNVCLTIKDGEEHECKEDDKNNAIQLLKDTTQCPKCDILIQKSEGCNQMKCHRCGANFDFVSGTLQQTNVELMGRDRDLNKWTSHHESTVNDLVKFVENSLKNEKISGMIKITYLKNDEDVHKIIYENNVMDILMTKATKMGIQKSELETLKEKLSEQISEMLHDSQNADAIVSGLYRILFVNDVQSILDAEKIVYFVMCAYYEEFHGADIPDFIYGDFIIGVRDVLLQTFPVGNVKPVNNGWYANSAQLSRTTSSNIYIRNRSTSSDMMYPFTRSTTGSNIYNDVVDFFDNREVNMRMQEESTSSVERRSFSGNNIGTFVRQNLPENPSTISRNREIMRQQSNAQTPSTDSLLIYRRRSNNVPHNVCNFAYHLRTIERDSRAGYYRIFISYFMDKYENIVYFIYGKMIFVIDLSGNVCRNVCMFDNESSEKYEILNVKKFNDTYTMLLRFADNYNAITRVVFQKGQSFLTNMLIVKETSREILLSNIEAIVKGHTRKNSVIIVRNNKMFEYAWGTLFDQTNFQPDEHGNFFYDVPLPEKHEIFLYDVPVSVKNGIEKLKSVISHKNLFLFQFTEHCEITTYNCDRKYWETMKIVVSSDVLNVCFSPTGKYIIIVKKSNGKIIHEIMDMDSYETISHIHFIPTTNTEFTDLKTEYTDIYFQDDFVYFHYISATNVNPYFHNNLGDINAKKYVRIDLRHVINATKNSLRKRYDNLFFFKEGKECEASAYALFFAERESILEIDVNDFKLKALGVPYIAKISSNSVKALCNIARNVEYLNSHWGSKELDIHAINSDLRTHYSKKLNDIHILKSDLGRHYSKKLNEEEIATKLHTIQNDFFSDCEKNFRKYEMNVCKYKLFQKIKSRIDGILSIHKNRLIADGMICLQSIKSVEDDANQELDVINKFYSTRENSQHLKKNVDLLALNVQDIYCSQTYLRWKRSESLSIGW